MIRSQNILHKIMKSTIKSNVPNPNPNPKPKPSPSLPELLGCWMTERDDKPRVGKNKESKCINSKSKSSSSNRREKAALPSMSSPIVITESIVSSKVCRVGPHMNNPKAATTRQGTSGDGPLSPITPPTILRVKNWDMVYIYIYVYIRKKNSSIVVVAGGDDF